MTAKFTIRSPLYESKNFKVGDIVFAKEAKGLSLVSRHGGESVTYWWLISEDLKHIAIIVKENSGLLKLKEVATAHQETKIDALVYDATTKMNNEKARQSAVALRLAARRSKFKLKWVNYTYGKSSPTTLICDGIALQFINGTPFTVRRKLPNFNVLKFEHNMYKIDDVQLSQIIPASIEQ